MVGARFELHMTHGISEQQWLEYIAGGLDRAERERVLTHAERCADCARLLSELEAWHDLMTAEAARLRRACRLPDGQLDDMLARSLERIHAAEPAGLRQGLAWTVREAMSLLSSLTESFGGPGTARATMDLAVLRSTDSRGVVTGTNWRLFVANLSEVIDSVCGSAAARLVGRAGACLMVEEC
jgi:hypothetical protein